MPPTRSGDSPSHVCPKRWVRASILVFKLLLERCARCNCAYVNLRFVTNIRRHKTGKTIKTFHIVGVPNFERVLLWTWRDLFVSMLASSPRHRHAIPDMLQDIQAVLIWEALPKMVLGNKTSQSASLHPLSHL